jgi:hypothetical protein
MYIWRNRSSIRHLCTASFASRELSGDHFLALIQQLLYTKYSPLISSSFLPLTDSGSNLVIRKQLTWSKVALEMCVFLSYVYLSISLFFGGAMLLYFIVWSKLQKMHFCNSLTMLWLMVLLRYMDVPCCLGMWEYTYYLYVLEASVLSF